MNRKVIYSILGAIVVIIVGFLIAWIVSDIQTQQLISAGSDGDSASWGGLIGLIEYTLIAIIVGGPLGAVCGYKIGKRADKRNEEQKPTDQL
jgi:fluoride ion exporter CrcB/FEX